MFQKTCYHKDENIGFDGYIGIWILRIYPIYQRYIDGYFYMNIDVSEIKLLLSIYNHLIKSGFQILQFKYISDISLIYLDISRYISDILPKN